MKETLWKLRHFKASLSPRKNWLLWQKDLLAWKRFWDSYHKYKEISLPNQKAQVDYLYPCLGDDTAETIIEPVYFYQNTWAFEKIVKNLPSSHIDVGSHHFYVALLSKILPVTMVDIRPLSLPLDTLQFKQGSILEMPYEDKTIESLSSLCVIEHIGLGRYGDPLDPFGTEKSVEELKRVIKPGGNLYISVPLDDENRTYFNAHRAFSEVYILKMFHPFKLVDKKYIYGNDFMDSIQTGFGTGCYHFQRL